MSMVNNIVMKIITSENDEGIEEYVKKVIEDCGLVSNLGIAVEYISKAGRKENAIENLNKAILCIKNEIERLEEEGERQRLSKRSYKTEQLLKEIKEDPIAMKNLTRLLR